MNTFSTLMRPSMSLVSLGFYFVLSCGGAPGQPKSPEARPIVKVYPTCPSEQLEAIQELCEAPQDAFDRTGSDRLEISPVPFSALPGWKRDRIGQAIPAFLKSCTKIDKMEDDTPIGTGPYGGTAKDWRQACTQAKKLAKASHGKARRFFEKHFQAYEAKGAKGPMGRMTGYYVQQVRASRKRGGVYQFPIYKRPDDLVAASLSEFIQDGRSRRIWGRMNEKGTKFEPYPTRAEFRQKVNEDEAALLWLDSPRDTLLLGIEGSGRAVLDDGSVVMLAFAGKNGRRSGAPGLISREMRKFEAKHFKKNRKVWSKEELALYESIIDQKDSLVFFEIESRNGAIGSQNVVLTPGRSLAVDRAVIPLSTPVWVSTRAPSSPKGPHGPYQRLFIAQDTGGAINGAVRGDIYWGDDAKAHAMGRLLNAPGRMWLLLPRGL
jgi:membrane-bound lytic murein transglycosylase A